MSKSKRLSKARRTTLDLERLESRLALDADGSILGSDVHLTLSFAPDGTSIAGQSNQLSALFDAIAPREVWQEQILSAFQTWAVNTNADIGLVNDGGQTFGSGGASQGDVRFGDIRIGAIAMAPNVAAVSIPIDRIVSGTWSADVLFNTAYNFQTIDDILAIALHESGNVFGLKDSEDPASPLHPGDPPTVRQPTANDLALLQALHGVRRPDLNEFAQVGGDTFSDNDSFAHATELPTVSFNSGSNGSAPTVVYGDIVSATDRDFFFLNAPGSYEGPLTLQVRTRGMSLLKPMIRVFDDAQLLITEGVSTSMGGDLLTVELPSIDGGRQYYFEVASSDGSALNLGGYSLVATFDDINLASPAQIDEIAGGAYRNLPAEELAKFFDADEDFFNDDDHTDDDIGTAQELETTPGFLADTRYEVLGSIADSLDADLYDIAAPEGGAVVLDVMTISLRSLDNGGLVPLVRVFDEDGAPIQATTVANGGGDYIIQVSGITSGDDYIVKVEAAEPGGMFDTGNYHLVVTFSTDEVPFESLGIDPLPSVGNGTTQNIHTLYVGKPQLFHFVMEAEDVPTAVPTVLVATIYNEEGQAVYQVSARPGEIRSREAVLLAPGTYTVRVAVLTLDGSMAPEIHYNIRWTAISDPFVGDPSDPTANPFACDEPGMEGFFCYPGDIHTTDPSLWDAFVQSRTDPPTDIDPFDTLSALFGDWWTWVWSEFTANGPVFANNDRFFTNSGTLSVGQSAGLLANDVDPESQEFLAVLRTSVTHGTLELQPDGGFTYLPEPGFSGTDSFTYSAFDFSNDSNVATVTIVIGETADFISDGFINGRDFLAWQRGFGVASGAALADGDANYDGAVNGIDLAIWQDQYPEPVVVPASNGDADGDGDIDGRDFLAWQRGFGLDSGAGTADGDFNGDHAVNSIDLGTWQANYGAMPVSALVTSETAPSTLLVARVVPMVSVSPSGSTDATVLGTSTKLSHDNRNSMNSLFLTGNIEPANTLERTVNAPFATIGQTPKREFPRQQGIRTDEKELAWNQCADELVQQVRETIQTSRLSKWVSTWRPT